MEVLVKSSNLHSVEYDKKKKELAVKFTTDHDQSYVYKEVPKKVFDNLIKSESKGKFFHQEIKNKFKFEKIRFKKQLDLLWKFLDEKEYKGERTILQVERKESEIFVSMLNPYGLFIIKGDGTVIDDYDVFS